MSIYVISYPTKYVYVCSTVRIHMLKRCGGRKHSCICMCMYAHVRMYVKVCTYTVCACMHACMPCHAMPCHAMPCHAMPCHANAMP